MTDSQNINIVAIISELKNELADGNITRTTAFLDLVLSNGDALVELEEQLTNEGM